MEGKYIKYTTTIICALLIMILCYVLIPKGVSNDLFFDIKTGKTIFKYGIDFKDHFSFIPNLTYIYHHYLFDIIVFKIYNLFGYFGLSVLFTFITTLFCMVAFFICKKYSNSNLLSFITVLITIYISRFMFAMRVQTITYLLFYLQLYFSEQLYKTSNKKYSILIILNSILIANLHMPLWIFSVILYLPFLIEGLLNLISNKIKSFSIFKTENTKYSLIIVTFIILLFTGLFTPLKLYPYTFFTKSLFNNTYTYIMEMQKTQLFYELRLVFILLFVVASLYLNILKLKLRDLILIIGLFIFALIANRNVIYFYLFVPTIYVKSLDIRCNFDSNKIRQLISRINFKIVNTFIIIVLSSFYIFLVVHFDYKNYNYDLDDYPVKTANYIKNNLDYKNIKLYNDFNYGSYLLFRDIPVFIDSRAEVYIGSFNGGYDIMEDYAKTANYKDYKEIFNKYQFDYALTYKDFALYDYLNDDNNFELIFEENDTYALFKRID